MENTGNSCGGPRAREGEATGLVRVRHVAWRGVQASVLRKLKRRRLVQCDATAEKQPRAIPFV